MTESNAATTLSGDGVNKAIANLAIRVATLEEGAAVEAQGSGDGTDLRPALSKALAGLKDLRSVMMAGTSEVEEHMKELAATKEENKKLKYQIKHLKRSLEAEEKKNTV